MNIRASAAIKRRQRNALPNALLVWFTKMQIMRGTENKIRSRGVFWQALIGVVAVAAVAIIFFVFYVGPQSQEERDRIFRSMNQVSRLIDERTMAVDQALQTWEKAPNKQTVEDGFQISGFRFGCSRKNIVCLSHKSEPKPAGLRRGEKSTSVPDTKVSFTLQSLAEDVELPYSKAILLIADSEGNVLAGHDADGKWLQYQSLELLINSAVPAVSDAKTKEDGQADRLVRSAQRFGRGEQNQVFGGYPARLSRDIGGQAYAVFVASHQLGRSLHSEERPAAASAEVMAEPDRTPSAMVPTGNKAGSTVPRPNDQIIFAYVVPEKIIDGGALSIPSQWTVNLLLVLVAALLSIPFLKLFNRSPLKPIRLVDLFSIMTALMLIITTATLLLGSVLLRNSVAQDIESELSKLSGRVASSVLGGLAEHDVWRDRAPPDRTAPLAQRATVENAFVIGADGTCSGGDVPADCGKGLWTVDPIIANLNIRDRAYFRAWRDNMRPGNGNYVQFLRSKSNGKLSWGRIIDLLPEAKGKKSAPVRRGLMVSAMPLALRAPVLPRNFAFVIVLNTDLPTALQGPGSVRFGDVQYHSEQRHSLIENFLDEARQDPKLSAAIRGSRGERGVTNRSSSVGGEGKLIPIKYHGRSQFALVRPISDTPWSVVGLYDRTEVQSLFAESVARAFFLCCLWILLCIGACWTIPRILRLTLDRGPGHAPRRVPLRARSIWFFPNSFFDFTPDGFSYRFISRLDEMALRLVALVIQIASLILLPPALAVLAVCATGLATLVGHYLLIARPHDGGRSATVRRAVIAAGAMLLILPVLYALTQRLHDVRGWVWVVAIMIVYIVVGPWIGWWRSSEDDAAARPNFIRRAFINRAIALLVVLVALPSIGILTLYYNDYLKGYVGASLITAAEGVADQRRQLALDLKTFGSSPSTLIKDLNLASFDAKHPGWFVGRKEEGGSGIFAIAIEKPGKDIARTVASGRGGDFGAKVYATMEDLIPHFGRSNVEAESSAALLQERFSPDHIFILTQPERFEPIQTAFGWGMAGSTLSSGPIERFPFHPDGHGLTVAALFCLLFYVWFFWLTRKIAINLTGLYMNRTEPSSEDTVAQLDQLIDESPRHAWEALESDAQRARLLTLAHGRTLNFQERVDIQRLVEQGYLELTPYVRIRNEKLADYLRHDLPRDRRAAILQIAEAEDDSWEHMRVPVFVALGAGCVLLAYSSPGAVQLVVSGFLALSALLPLTRDPINRFLEMQKG